MSNSEDNNYFSNSEGSNSYFNNGNSNNEYNVPSSKLGSTRSRSTMLQHKASQKNQPLFALKHRNELSEHNKPLARYSKGKRGKSSRAFVPSIQELPRNTQTALSKAHKEYKNEANREQLFENIRSERALPASERGAQVFTTVFNQIRSFLNDRSLSSREKLSNKIRNALKSATPYVNPDTIATARIGQRFKTRETIQNAKSAHERKVQEGKQSSTRHRGGKKKSTKKVVSKK